METNATSPLIVDIPATQLKPNPANPRKSVGDVTELAASIKAQGLQQQLLVTPAGNDKDGKPSTGSSSATAATRPASKPA